MPSPLMEKAFLIVETTELVSRIEHTYCEQD